MEILKRHLRVYAAFIWFFSGALVADTLVLIGAADTAIEGLSSLQLRKAYLGIPVTIAGQQVIPFVNLSDAVLEDRFQQKIVGMSKSSYQRKLQRNRLNYAVNPPKMYKQQALLLRDLSQTPSGISYAWVSSLDDAKTPIKVIQVIWHED